MRSKRKDSFITRHLNFPYIRKNKKKVYPVDKMSKQDMFFLKNFNFYHKNIDFVQTNVDKNDCIVEKSKSHESTCDNDELYYIKLMKSLEEIKSFNDLMLDGLKSGIGLCIGIIHHLKI